MLVHAHIERTVSETGMHALLLAVGGIVAAGLVVLAVTVALLLWRKIPAPVIVLGVMILGFAL